MLLERSSLAVRDAKIGFRERDFHKKKNDEQPSSNKKKSTQSKETSKSSTCNLQKRSFHYLQAFGF